MEYIGEHFDFDRTAILAHDKLQHSHSGVQRINGAHSRRMELKCQQEALVNEWLDEGSNIPTDVFRSKMAEVEAELGQIEDTILTDDARSTLSFLIRIDVLLLADPEEQHQMCRLLVDRIEIDVDTCEVVRVVPTLWARPYFSE